MTIRILAATVLASACGEVADTALSQSPPPLSLEVVGIVKPESQVGIMVNGLGAGERVWVAVSSATAPGATCPSPTLCIDLIYPSVLGSAVADNQGRARFTLPRLPADFRVNGQLYFQAASLTAASDVESRLSAGVRSPDETVVHNIFMEYDSSGIGGTMSRSWYDQGRLLCSLEADLSASSQGNFADCPNCVFAYKATIAGFDETGGDCHGLLGLDPSSIPSEVIGLGRIRAWSYVSHYRPGVGWGAADYQYGYHSVYGANTGYVSASGFSGLQFWYY